MTRYFRWTLALAFFFPPLAVRTTTLPPELKAYDFAQAYYLEDGGIVIDPYTTGFVTSDGVATPEGIRIMPGGSFTQYQSGRQICEQYRFVKLSGTRAFFHERLFRYRIATNALGRHVPVRGEYLGSNDFYLSQFRNLEWFDHAFPVVELHPGLQEWRSKNYLSGGR